MTPAPPLAVLATCNEAGRGVRVEFQQTGDVLVHTVCIVSAQGLQPALHSFAVSGQQGDLQPCLTQWYQQEKALLLTGAGGGGHWSMSVQPVSVGAARGSTRELLLFDLACRIKELPPGLTSRYRPAEGCHIEPSGSDSTARISIGSEALQVGAYLLDPAELPQCSVTQPSADLLQIHPRGQLPEQFPATVRWSYAVWVT